MTSRNSFAWIIAIVIGSLINISLFLFLPAIGRTAPPKKPQIIELDFMTWQQPIQQKTKASEKTKQKPKEQPKAKPKMTKMKILKQTELPQKEIFYRLMCISGF